MYKTTVLTVMNPCHSISPAGDTRTVLFPNLGHFDFVHSDCKGNELYPSQDCQGVLTSDDADSIANELNYAVTFSRWSVASARALSYGDNEKLTPGRNDSKPYPGDIRVNFTEFPIPGTSPQVLCPLLALQKICHCNSEQFEKCKRCDCFHKCLPDDVYVVSCYCDATLILGEAQSA